MRYFLQGCESILNAWPDLGKFSHDFGTADELTARAWQLTGESLLRASELLIASKPGVSIPVKVDSLPEYRFELLALNDLGEDSNRGRWNSSSPASESCALD